MSHRQRFASSVLCLLGFVLLHTVTTLGAEHQLRVLVLTGKNNHDWRGTTPTLQSIFEESGRFVVTALDDPSLCNDRLLETYDVIVSNWTNFPNRDREWGETSESAIMKFVRSGKGFVLFHAASASFPSWPEYRELTGAGWGEQSGHGPYRAFAVSVADRNHPITRVTDDFVTGDELWHGMEIRPGAHVLCTAYSDTAGGGSGRREPVAFSMEFGRGRCFNLVLGHDVPAMLNPNWRLLLLRGTEWAATGEATIEIPLDVVRVLANAAGYRQNGSRVRLSAVEQLVQMSSRNSSLRHQLAGSMAGQLESGSSVDWKKFLCEQLSLIGTSGEVPSLARLLNDSVLGFHARLALERIPGDESTTAVRHAAVTSKGRPLVGLVNASGERRDSMAVDAMRKHLERDQDGELGAAALQALGKIGGPDASRVLISLWPSVPQNLRLIHAESLLRCAEQYESGGKLTDAADLYGALNSPSQLPQVRVAAFMGVVRCSGDRARAMVLGALESEDEVLQSAVIQFLKTPAGRNFSGDAALRTGALSDPLRSQMMYALSDLGERGILPELYRALASKDRAVRMAAIYGVGRLGDSSSVERLCAMIRRADGQELAEIRKSFVRLRGPGVDERFIAGHSSAAIRKEMIRALAARDCRKAVPALLSAAEGEKGEVRREALKALGSLADGAISPDLVRMLKDNRFSGERETIERTLVSLGRRDQTPDRVCDVLLAELPESRLRDRVSILRVLGAFGGDRVLRAVRSSLTDPEPEIRLTAIRVLSDWPDSAPLEDLLAIAHGSGDSIPRVLAQRGCITLLENSPDLKDEERVKMIDQELRRAESVETRRLLLSVLGKQNSVQALTVAASYLDQREIADEACAAVAGISQGLTEKHPRECREALQRALDCVPSPAVAERVRSVLARLNLRTNQRRINVAVVTGGHAFDESSFLGLFEHDGQIQFTHLPLIDDSEVFEDISAWPYDVIVLYNLTQKISEKRRQNFLRLLDDGVGLLSLHHASGSFQEWEVFRKIIGCRYVLYPQEQHGKLREPSTYRHDVTIPVHIQDSSHSVTRGLTDFVVQDETYRNCEFEPDNRVLLSTTEPSSDQPLGWVRTYQRSNVCHFQLGHGSSIFSNEHYRMLVEQAISWCAQPRLNQSLGGGTRSGREQ